MQIQRERYLEKLVTRMHNGLVKVVTGIRRSGKSYLLLILFRQHLLQAGVPANHILIMEFDRLENAQYRDPFVLLDHLKKQMVDRGNYYILLDEVQMLERFEEVLNSLMHEPNADIYVTGSNSQFLSSDVLTEFRGRGDEIHVFPLSFGEFMQVYEGDAEHGWAEYMTYGGLPLTVTMRTDEQKIHYLQSLFQETYLKDIVDRNHLEKRQELEDLVDVLASSIGSLTNPSRITATFQSKLHSSLTCHTVIEYLRYLKEAYLIDVANRYDVKGRKYIGTPLKYYFEDVGLRNARLHFRQMEETHLMENILYNELRSRGFNVDVGSVSERYVDSESGRKLTRHREIDFVANLGSKRYYIQSAFRIPNKQKEQQEKAPLLALSDSFLKILIVKDIVKPYYDANGILVLGLLDFLRNSGNSSDVK